MKNKLYLLLLLIVSIQIGVAQSPGNCLNFDGSNDYVTTGTPALGAMYTYVSNFTIEFWMKPNAADNDGAYHGIIGYQGSARNPSIWCNSNKIHCDEAAGGTITSVAVLNQDKWNHVAWVKNGANNTLYINGVFANAWTTAATSYLYGNYNIGYIDNYFSGSIDEVRFWNTSLSLSTIQANMFNEISGSTANLMHYYKCNSSTGYSFVDSVSSGASNGTLNNFALSGASSNWLESYAMVTPTNCTTTNPTTTGFTANWSASVAGSSDGYYLDVSNSPTFDTFVSGYNGLSVGTATSYAVTGLSTAGNSYYWRVRSNKTSVTGQGYLPGMGTLGIAATPPGNALNFDGSNDNVYLPEKLTRGFANPANTAITIEYWFRGSNVQSAVRFNDGSGNYIIAGWGSVGSQTHVISTDGGTSSGLAVGSTVNDGKWHHVAMTWQKNTTNGFKSYLDGQLVAQRNSANVNLPAIGSTTGYLGITYTGNEPMNGTLDEVRIYTVARTQAEIQADMYSTATTTSLPTGLLAYYKMDQATASGTNTGLTSLYDASGNGNTGVLQSFALTGATSNWVESYAQITPQNLTSSAAGVTGFTASWTAPTIGTVTSYVIDVATDPAFTYLVSGYSAKNVGNVLTTDIIGLANGTTYYWRVRADKTSVTGTGNNSAYQTATTTYQKPGQGLNFDGVDDYVAVGSGGSLTGSNPFAVELWMRTTSTTAAYLVQQREVNNIAGEYILQTNADGTVYFWVFNGTVVGITSTQTVNDGKWHHIAATREADMTLRIYIDGNIAAVGTVASQALGNMYMCIGKDYRDGASLFNGTMDEIRIWNTGRTQAQIQANMYDEISPSTTGLAHYYKFNTTSGTTLTDSVTTGTANGTLTNFALTSPTTSNWVESYAMVVPSNFSSTNGSSTGFTANWSAPAVGTVESYKLDVSTSPNFNTLVSGYNGLDVGTATTYAVTGLSNVANTYYWRVRANKSSVNGQGANPTRGILGVSATPPGNALNFDGSNDYANLPPRLTSDFTNPVNTAITIEYWFKGSNLQSAVRFQDGSGYIVAGWGGTVGQQTHIISTDGGSASGLPVGAAATDGKWHHVAMTWQKNTVNGFKSYLDGQLVAQRNSANVNLPTITNNYGYIGILYNGAEATYGSMDEVRLYNIARTQAEIQADMYSTDTTNLPSSLLAYYKFDQGAAGGTNTGLTTLVDQTVYNNNATLQNFALTGATSNWVESYAEITPRNPTTSAITPNGFTASWTASTLGTADSYVIDVATDTAFANLVSGYAAKNVGNVLTTTITGLGNSTNFYWRVRAEKASVTGTGNNTAYQTATTTFQKPGQALNFDGVDDRAQGTGTQPSTITVEAWIRTNTVALQEIVEFNSTTAGRVTEFRLYNSNKLCVGTTGNNAQAYQEIVSNATIPSGKWTHVAYVKSGSTYYLYINGVLDNSGTINYPDPTMDRINIGSYSASNTWNNGYTFNGGIDEVRIWNVARTAADIQSTMYDEISPSTSGLIHYYNFNAGAAGGTTLTDLVTTGTVNQTLTNFALTGTTSNWVESYAMVAPTAPNTTSITNAGFTANWSASTVGTVDNYILDVATDSAFTSFVSGYNGKLMGATTSCAITGLEQNTIYYWRVRAEKASVTGQGKFTATQTVNTLAEALNLSSTTTTNNFNLLTNSAITVDPNVLINYTHNITGFSVVISGNKQPGDILSYTGTLPTGITATAYNASTGVLSFSGTTSPANWQTLMRTVTFRAYTNPNVNRTISFSAGSLNSFNNGHYYEFVATTDTWSNSKTAASNRKYLNYTGYLTTVSSQAENDYIKQILNANAWMGASDDYLQINAATGATTYANQTASEGHWYWVTGPEAGTPFSSTNNPATPVSGRFNNWYTGEPNNSNSVEHYGEFYSASNGTWNDLPNSTLRGYIVEYGGMPNDMVQTPSYTLTMSVTTTPPGNALNFDGTNDYVYTTAQQSNPTTFTLEAWFNTTTTSGGGIVGFNDFTNNSPSNYDRFIWMGSDGKINFGVWNGSSNILTSTNAYNDGKYHHVAATFSTSVGMKLYVDGVLLGSNTLNSVTSYSGYWKIGGFQNWGPSTYFNGTIDEVRIWNTVRSQAEITANMLSILPASTSGLSYYYSFDEGIPSGSNSGLTTLYDHTSNANNGTMTGFALSGSASNWVESYAVVVPQANTTAITASGFTANWTAPTIGTLNNYILEVSTNSGFTSFVSGYNNKNVGSSTSFAVTGLSPFSTYYWRVRADKTSVTGKGGYLYQTVLTAKEPINITSTTATNTFNLLTNSAIVVDPNITVNYSQNISGFRVLIGNNKQDGDVLAYTGTLPSGVTATAYDSSTGLLVFTGSTSSANWQALLRTVTFRAYKNSSAPRSISFSVGALNSFSNGHFYELVSTTDTWTNSKTAAAGRTYLNYQGYLATVTSSAENDFIKQYISNTTNAWIGASDEYSQINLSTGTNTYADQNASEGKWYWVTGPEAGTQFMTANGNNPVSGMYTNWNSGEPNNANSSEHYAQYTSASFAKWNDLPNSSTLGYIVEYGGLASDIVQTPSYTLTMNVSATEPGNALNFDGTDDYVSIPDANSLDLTTNYTIEAWIKPETFNNLAGIVSKYQTGASMGYTLRLTSTSPYTGIDFDQLSTANGILTANHWYHIAAVKNGSTRTIYVNGVAVPTTGSALTTAANTDPIRIGCDFSARYFDGNIDEVRIWGVARTQAEILANMNTNINPSTANLVSYYNFNQFIPGSTNTGLTTVYDQTTTLNNGTLTNFGLTSSSNSNWVESYAMVVPTTTAATSKYSLGFTANWTAPSIGTTEKYYLDVATDANFTSLVTGYSNKDVGSVTSYAVNTGLTASTTYYYRVRSEKASVTGTGGYSNTTTVTTNPTETLIANAASDRTSTSFTANWSAPAIHNISNYTLDVSTNNTFTAPITGSPFTVAGLSQNITGLTPNTNYYYRIRVTGYNNSNIINASTFAPFAAIATTATNACVNTTSPVVTFTGSGSTAPYTFVYTLNGGSNQTITTTSGSSVSLSVPTTTAGNFTYALVSVTDANNGTNAQTGTVSININSLPSPSFTVTPNASVCSKTDVTYTTQSGQSNYVWTVPGTLGTDYTISSGGIGNTSSSVTLKWLSSGDKTVSVNYTNSSNCTSTAASTTTTVNSSPTVASITGTTTTTVGLSTTLSNLTTNGAWTSSNPTVASINSNGVVTAIGQGTSTISYTVTTGSCSTVVTTTYTVNAAPTPTITSVSPTLAVVGATITITGTNFLGASTVTIGSYQTVFTIVSATSITATVPQGTGSSLAITVTTPGGTATSTSPNLFTFNTAGVPTITSFSPTSAGAGQTVVITGTNLLNPSSITFGGTDVAGYTVNSATQITVTIGSGTTGTVSVTTPGGTGTKTGFTFLTCAGNPTIYAGGSLSMCTTESPINITNYSNASNYAALTWTTSGTGTFANNSTANALTTTTYSPSAADITAGTVTLTLTATANSGCNDAIDTKVVTIYAAPIGGTISGGTAVCTGTNSTTLTLNGSSGNITKWQSSTSNDFSANITDISNTTTSYTATNLTATTYYRAVINNGTCATVYSSIASISVDRRSVSGTISGATTVCTDNNSTTLSLNGYTGTIQWQSSTDNTTFNSITGATNSTYTATNLSATTYYRAVVTSGSCSAASSTSVSIIVSPTSVAGTISGATSVCTGTNSTTLTLNGNTGSIQWQSSTDNNTFNSITGATNSTYTATNLSATTYYRVVVTSGVCSSATTPSVTMTVSPTTVAGTISGATTVCSGTNSNTLTLNNSVGSIQWQSSTNNTTFSNINGATNATYNVVNLTQTTYYRAVVSSGVCSSATTSSATMTVSPTSIAGSISGATTVCATSNSTTLTLTGSTGSIQWQSSIDNDNFTDISGATASTYTATNLTTTTYYRAVVTSGVCSSATTPSVTMTVSPTTVAGTISGATTVCSGTNSNTITLNNSVGSIQWQSSTNNTTFSNINGATNATYNVVGLTQTTYYRAIVSSGVCSSATTSSVTMTVSPTSIAGTISGATTVCANSNSTTLTLTGSTGSIQWQSSTDNTSFSDINGATTSTYTATNLSITTYYRAIVTSGVCNYATTATVHISVDQSPVSGSITGTATVCTGSNSTLLSLSGNEGNVQWQYSTNGTTYSNITGSNGNTYTATNLTSTTYYRVVVSNGVCSNATTNMITVSVSPSSVAGSISGGATVCANSNSTTLTLTGYTGTIQWQSSTNNIAFTTISGATNASYTATNLSATTYYRAVVTSGACSSATTASTTITVDPIAVAGTISGGTTVCLGTNSTNLTLSSSSGSIQWQSSTDNSNFTSISGATGTSYMANNLNTTTYYRVKLSSGVCQAVYTPSATISIDAGSLLIGSIGAISGPTNICGLNSAIYTVQSVTGASYYNWTLPAGASSTSTNGNSVLVTFDSSYITGTISVKAINSCGVFSNNKLITVNNKAQNVSISGNTSICGNTTGTYSATYIANSYYSWTLPDGITLVSGDGTNSIQVMYENGFSGGTITLVVSTQCGDSLASLAVSSNTKIAQTITGPTLLCGYTNTNVTYTTPTILGVTSYDWTIPNGATIIAGQGTHSIQVSFPSNFVSGLIGVTLTSSCGIGPQKTISISTSIPRINIFGARTICNSRSVTYDTSGALVTTTFGNETYSVPIVNGAISYQWTVPSGMTIVSGQNTNSITVSINLATFNTGNISVSIQNSCGISTTCSLNISKYSTVATITGTTNLCNSNEVTYSVPETTGTDFNWTLPSWMTITSGQGTSTITATITGSIEQTNIILHYTSNCNTSEIISLNVNCSTITKVRDVQCGITLASISTPIYANPVSIASNYRFEVTNGTTVNFIDSPTRNLLLTQLPGGAVYNTTYSIRVAIQLNGIWQNYGASCNVSTPAIPTTQVQDSQCGITLPTMTSAIYANSITIATAYRFEVTGGNNVKTYVSNTRYFNLSQLSGGSLYGTTYSIRVAIQFNGIWQSYGSSCTISTPAIPNTHVQDSQCGITLSALSSTIYANNVAIATAYRFEVTNGSNVRSYDSNTRYFNLTQLNGGTLYGITYSIRVAIKYNDTWQAYGSACNISTPAVPTTQVQASQCGTTLAALGTNIYANTVTIATGYRFEVTNGTSVRTFDSTTRSFKLTQLSGTISNGTTYSIRVAIQYNGVWQNYGNSCEVYTPGIAKIETVQTSVENIITDSKGEYLKAFPNPFADTFAIQMSPSGSNELIDISIYDMLGSLVKRMEVEEQQLNVINIGEEFPSGVYNVIMTQGETSKSVRVIKR